MSGKSLCYALFIETKIICIIRVAFLKAVKCSDILRFSKNKQTINKQDKTKKKKKKKKTCSILQKFVTLGRFILSLKMYTFTGLAFWWRAINSSPQKLTLNPTGEWFVAHLVSFHYHLIALFHGNHSPAALHKPFRKVILGSPRFFKRQALIHKPVKK